MKVKLIVARSENNIIGKDGQLPWEVKGDLSIFKHKTLNELVVMGRKTFESLPQPLSDRVNVVFTRNKKENTRSVRYVSSIEEVFNIAKLEKKNIWVIGGKEIYDLFLPYVEEHHVTTIFGNYEGDTYFDLDYDENFEQLSSGKYENFRIDVYGKRK